MLFLFCIEFVFNYGYILVWMILPSYPNNSCDHSSCTQPKTTTRTGAAFILCSLCSNISRADSIEWKDVLIIEAKTLHGKLVVRVLLILLITTYRE